MIAQTITRVQGVDPMSAQGRDLPVAEHLRSAPTIEKPYLLSACGFSDGERETAEHDGPTDDRR